MTVLDAASRLNDRLHNAFLGKPEGFTVPYAECKRLLAKWGVTSVPAAATMQCLHGTFGWTITTKGVSR